MSNHKMNGALAIVVFLSRARWTSSSPTESRQCRPGFFHNVTLDLCQVCPSGMYTDSYNLKSRCNQCSRCTGLHMVVTACNASSDTVCRCPDGYYEHDDGCSPKTVAHVEERPYVKPEWTWTQSLLIVTFVAVIILAISLALHCSGVTKKLPSCPLKCKKEQSRLVLHPNDTAASAAPGRANNTTPQQGSETSEAAGGAAVASSSTPRANNTTPQQRSETSEAAGGATVASSSTPFIEITERGAADAGAQGKAAQRTAPISVQVQSESKLAITPQKEHGRSQTGDAAGLQKVVATPFSTNTIEPTNLDKLEADVSTGRCQRSDHPAGCTKCSETRDPFTATLPPQQHILGLDHQDGCVRCNEKNDFLAAVTMSSSEEVQLSIPLDFAMADTDESPTSSNRKTDELRVNFPGIKGSRDHAEAETPLHEDIPELQPFLPKTERKN